MLTSNIRKQDFLHTLKTLSKKKKFLPKPLFLFKLKLLITAQFLAAIPTKAAILIKGIAFLNSNFYISTHLTTA